MAWAGEGYEVDFLKKWWFGEGGLGRSDAEIKVGLGNCVFAVILKKCKNENDADGL